MLKERGVHRRSRKRAERLGLRGSRGIIMENKDKRAAEP